MCGDGQVNAPEDCDFGIPEGLSDTELQQLMREWKSKGCDSLCYEVLAGTAQTHNTWVIVFQQFDLTKKFIFKEITDR